MEESLIGKIMSWIEDIDVYTGHTGALDTLIETRSGWDFAYRKKIIRGEDKITVHLKIGDKGCQNGD